MKKLSMILAIVLSLALLCGCGSAAQTSPANAGEAPAAAAATEETAPEKNVIVAKLAHTAAMDGCYQIGAEKFAELVSEKTNGDIRVDIYANSQLGSDNEVYESLQMNAVQFDIAGFDGMGAFVPDVKIFNLAFLYNDREEALKAVDSEVFRNLTEQYKQYGIHFLGCFDAGFRQLETVDKPINSLEDLKGMKIRVPEDKAFMDTFAALGAAPTPTAYSEVFMSLQNGVIDGIEVPLDVFAGNGFGEVCKYFAYINYRFNAPALYVSEQFYQSLTEEQQKAIDEAALEATAYERQWIAENESANQGRLEEEWNVKFTNPDLDPFRKACEPLFAEVENQELLQQIFEVLGR